MGIGVDLYLLILIIAGSPAFGLEALLIGRGGTTSSLYGRKALLLRDCLLLGGCIVLISLILDFVLDLEMIYLSIFLLATTFLVGKATSLLAGGEASENSKVPSEEEVSEGEIESMLENRGLGHLVGEEEDSSEK